MRLDQVRGSWAGGPFRAFMEDSFSYGIAHTIADIIGHSRHGDIMANTESGKAVLRIAEDHENLHDDDIVLNADLSDKIGISKEIVERVAKAHVENLDALKETLSRVDKKGAWRTDFEAFHSGFSFGISHGKNEVIRCSLDSEGRNLEVAIMPGLEKQAAEIMIRLDGMVRTVSAEMSAAKVSEMQRERDERASQAAAEIDSEIGRLEI